MTSPNLAGLIESLAADILKLPRRIEPIGGQYCSYVTLGDVLDLVEQTKQRAALRTVSDEPGAAARDVLAERERQKTVEGWTAEHDDDYAHFEMARAASCYAAEAAEPTRRPAEEGDRPYNWPWHSQWWKPSSRRRNLVKAGALILAEIERLDRRASPDPAIPADTAGS